MTKYDGYLRPLEGSLIPSEETIQLKYSTLVVQDEKLDITQVLVMVIRNPKYIIQLTRRERTVPQEMIVVFRMRFSVIGIW